ncbi:MAG: YibE/F family protein [Bullifex sp.]
MRLPRRSEAILLASLSLILGILLIIPTGFSRQIYHNAVGSPARVISTDDSSIYTTGLFSQGEQVCMVSVLSGPHKGETLKGINMLSGSLADDKVFASGDKAWLLIERDDEGHALSAILIDHYRLAKELILAAVFVILMWLFAGVMGIRTVFSFLLAFLLIWKVLVPGCLHGLDPLMLSILVLLFLNCSTILLVSGVGKRSAGAITGSIISDLVICLFGYAVTEWFHLDGAVLPMSESLLFAGFPGLNLTGLFVGVMTLSSGGAVMDLSIDVAAAMNEVHDHDHSAGAADLFRSGMAVGRAGVGTQTTTLLLAYMGNYLSVMMVYMAQATPAGNILTSKAIAAELVQTAVGCTGLILVTPVTAAASAFFLTERQKKLDRLKKPCEK